MNKAKKDKNKPEEIPLDFQIESKNFNYTIILKDSEIEKLRKQNAEKQTQILNLQSELSNLSSAWANSCKQEKELSLFKVKYESLEKENEKLKEELNAQRRNFEAEKQQINVTHMETIQKLQSQLDSYHQKIDTVNHLIIDKKYLTKQVEELTKEMKDMANEHNEQNRQREVRNELKFAMLKKKMMENVEETQEKVTELNIQYMDVSTKLTLLQNHQLLIQLEYQSQQIDELKNKKESLENKVYELLKDNEIHKEVELSLAEKNKKLKNEINSLKLKVNNNSILFSESINMKENPKNYYDNNNKTQNLQNETNVSFLRKKIIGLEKKLLLKNKELNLLKDNTEYIEMRLRTYEKKYSGIFNFFEENLKNFCEDEDIKNNKEIFVNIEDIKNGNFSKFSKEEKYSILVIMMKYLLPLVNSNSVSPGQGGMDNINFKIHYVNTPSKKGLEESEFRKSIKGKYILKMKNTFSGHISIDSLPSIRRSKETIK